MIAPDDRGFTLGDGLFETLLAQDGDLEAWTAHIDRLGAGCRALGLPAPDPELVRRESVRALQAAGLEDARAAVRITWTAGPGGRGLDRPASPTPRLVVTAAPVVSPAGPARLITSTVRRPEMSLTARHKTLSSLDAVMARREAIAAGADEAVMLNSQGNLACAAAANLFWLEDGILCTPSLDCGVLAGTVRARIMAQDGLAVREVVATAEALRGARAIFLTNSLIGVRDVVELDGRVLPQQVGQSILATLRGRM